MQMHCRLAQTQADSMHAQVFVEDMPDIKSGYSIRFHFAENPYFQNETLEKRFTYHDDGTAEVTSIAPQWHPGKVRAGGLGCRALKPCMQPCCAACLTPQAGLCSRLRWCFSPAVLHRTGGMVPCGAQASPHGTV